MVRKITLALGFALCAAGCAALGEPVLDADGCRPAMAIYQPPVRLGGTGSILHIPRACPATAAPPPRSGAEASPD
jgi:hypothetical protein